jgi:hypothetical protein
MWVVGKLHWQQKKGEAERHATFLLVLEQKKDNLS